MQTIYDLTQMLIVVGSVGITILINLIVQPKIKAKYQLYFFIGSFIFMFIILGFLIWYFIDIGFLEPYPSEYRNLTMMFD